MDRSRSDEYCRRVNEFQQELSALLNKHSIDNDCNTPDFILAEYLVQQLFAYGRVAKKNAEWHGWML